MICLQLDEDIRDEAPLLTSGGIRSADGLSAAANGVSPPLGGNWGSPVAPPSFTVPVGVTGPEDVTFPVPGIAIQTTAPAVSVALTALAGAGSVLAAGAAPGATVTSADNRRLLTVAGPRAAVNATLDTLTYRGAPNANGEADILAVAGSAIAITTVLVTPVNDGPAVVAPATITVQWPWVDPATGVAVSDPVLPSGAGAVRVTIVHLSGGTISVEPAAGVTSTAPSGAFTTPIVLDGPLSGVNATLATLHVQEPDGCGQGTVSVTVDDLGKIGSGALVATKLLTIVSAPCDAATDLCPDGTPASARLSNGYDDFGTPGVGGREACVLDGCFAVGESVGACDGPDAPQICGPDGVAIAESCGQDTCADSGTELGGGTN